MKTAYTTLTALAILGVVSCGGPTDGSLEPDANQPSVEPVAEAPGKVTDTRAKLAELNQQIRSMAGMAYADDLKQCRLAEVGHRPCGGPEYYLAYSTTTVDEKVLQELIREHRELQINYQREHDVMGTCEVIPRPQLALQEGRCVAVKELAR
jgi:hypothetical protein